MPFTIRDIATGWVECFPVRTKTAEDTAAVLRQFAGPYKITELHSDNSKELESACLELRWAQRTSTLGRSRGNGIIEICNRLVLEGARTCLAASGLDQTWWSYAVRHFTAMWNVSRVNPDGATAFQRRFNQ